jgi:hypothetical protein
MPQSPALEQELRPVALVLRRAHAGAAKLPAFVAEKSFSTGVQSLHPEIVRQRRVESNHAIPQNLG